LNTQSTKIRREVREAMLEALPRVRRFARSLTGNPHDADDLLQSTVERVLERNVPEGTEVLKWMFRVCRNLWIDELRYREVRGRTATGDLPDPEGSADPSAGEAAIIGTLYLEQVEAAMAGLSGEQRAVLSLVAIEGLSYREAAEVLEIPIGTVMSRLARARGALADRLAESACAPAAVGKVEVTDEP
jgi:RNA polymerase sigma factor (sigma-70 family)